MKCNDIERLLNERELTEIVEAERAAIEAHCARCADCAAQWSAGEHVAAFRSDVPPMPASLRERAHQLEAECESATVPRTTRRPVILGSLFVLGAAATVFAAVPWSDTEAASQ